MCCEKHCAHDERTETPERRVLHDIGFFGHFIYTRRGGRGGKQHVLKTLYYADGQMTQRVLLEKTKTTRPRSPRSWASSSPRAWWSGNAPRRIAASSS